MFVALLKEKGVKHRELCLKFSVRWPNKSPPSRSQVYRISKKLHTHQTLDNRRKGNVGRPRSARTPANIRAVKEALEAEADRKPDQVGSSSRRNNLSISKSTFNRITRKDLKLSPYKIPRA